MARSAVSRRRPKIAATLNPTLLRAVDEWVETHPGLDRSKVIDEALWLWYAQVQETAMREQFEAPDDVDPDEYKAWEALRDSATARRLREPDSE